jgi:hypothetical protein
MSEAITGDEHGKAVSHGSTAGPPIAQIRSDLR